MQPLNILLANCDVAAEEFERGHVPITFRYSPSKFSNHTYFSPKTLSVPQFAASKAPTWMVYLVKVLCHPLLPPMEKSCLRPYFQVLNRYLCQSLLFLLCICVLTIFPFFLELLYSVSFFPSYLDTTLYLFSIVDGP